MMNMDIDSNSEEEQCQPVLFSDSKDQQNYQNMIKSINQSPWTKQFKLLPSIVSLIAEYSTGKLE